MRTKYVLDEDQIPRYYYNVLPDLPRPLDPPLHPVTKKPISPQDLAPLFPMELIKQEMSEESRIEIPEEVREMYKMYRPSPLFRAHRLERFLDTPAKIFYKYEGVSPGGSHKLNTAIAQAYYNKKEGIKRLATETGAGQWGSSLALACKLFDLECKVYMVRCSYEQKPYRRSMMQAYGATCIPSPSNETDAGRAILEKDPDCAGSLGIAISEAVEDAAKHDDTHYSLGSVLNHVLLHQTVIGLETKEQLKMADANADIIIGCVGGGSNFGGLALPFVKDKLKDNRMKLIGVEPASCPSLTKGKYAYDYGDTAMLAPLCKMYTLGSSFIPSGIHAGGLRYHGMSPIISALVDQGIAEGRAANQLDCFKAAVDFARTEGIMIAPETAHAVKAVIDEALYCRETGEEKTIVFNCSGHGHFDMGAYDQYFSGKLQNHEHPGSSIQAALKKLPKV